MTPMAAWRSRSPLVAGATFAARPALGQREPGGPTVAAGRVFLAMAPAIHADFGRWAARARRGAKERLPV